MKRISTAFLAFFVSYGMAVRAEPPTVSLRVLSFPRVNDKRPIEIRAADRPGIKILPSTNHLSEPVSLPAEAVWRIGHPVLNANGTTVFETLERVQPGRSEQQVLLLLRKGPKNEDGFQARVFDDGPGHFRKGQFFFLNLAHRHVAGDIGGRKFALKPGQHQILTPAADQGPDLCHVTLLIQEQKGWRPFMSSNWPLRPDTRGLVLLYEDPGSSKLRLHTIRDPS